ncbi:hypothetical protein G9A89_004171 [Geosiphon pyriformis]|nr:hypothetical protein G9A89_004171 [Geosiphon pyriformis]
MPSNIKVLFKACPPKGLPSTTEHMEIKHDSIDLETYQLEDGDILLRNLYLSLDPYMRGRMRDPSIKSYVAPFEVGHVLEGSGVAEVIKSKNEQYKVGDLVTGFIGWEQYTHISKSKKTNPMKILKDARENIDKIPLSYYIDVLGGPGLTAYGSLKRIGHPKAGETIFVTAASGAVGQVVGQIAKFQGLRVVGSAGEDAKVDYLINELHFDAAFNYKKVDLDKKLTETCPNGIDIYFDNVGGETLDIVLMHLNLYARVIACGMISQYNATEEYGIKNLMQIIAKRIRIEGFIVFDYFDLYDEFFNTVRNWLLEGKIVYKEDITEGIENAPDVLISVFTGKNFGKAIVKIADL